MDKTEPTPEAACHACHTQHDNYTACPSSDLDWDMPWS